jgi:hypothetical protein
VSDKSAGLEQMNGRLSNAKENTNDRGVTEELGRGGFDGEGGNI